MYIDGLPASDVAHQAVDQALNVSMIPWLHNASAQRQATV